MGFLKLIPKDNDPKHTVVKEWLFQARINILNPVKNMKNFVSVHHQIKLNCTNSVFFLKEKTQPGAWESLSKASDCAFNGQGTLL